MRTAEGERMVRANGVDLCLQAFGDPADPAILLISGASASMLNFPDGLCELLADGGRYAIRYDHRDTGRSVTYPIGEPPYTGRDLAEDALGILDALGIERAHLAGMSMGGGIAQYLALHHPDRVASLTLISTSPAARHDRELPGMAKAVADEFAAVPEPADWSDREAAVEYVFAIERLCASRARPPDDAFFRGLAERTVERAASIGSLTNHDRLTSGVDEQGALADIAAPTLVIHGTDDPLLPLPHGAALAEGIPGATLLQLEEDGHELPPAVWDTVAAAILRHTAG